MALKKSELYSSLWASCDELRGGMDASQYKDYVLVLLFIKYISDKYAGVPYAPITIPQGASFKDMVALKGKPDIGDQINKKIIAPLANANQSSRVRLSRLQRPDQARQRQGDGRPAHQPDRHLREPGPRFLEEPRRGRRHPGRRLRIPDAPLRHRERQEQGPVLHPGRGQPGHRADPRHPRGQDQQRHHRLRPDLRLGLAAAQGRPTRPARRSRSTGRKRTPPPAAWRA